MLVIPPYELLQALITASDRERCIRPPHCRCSCSRDHTSASSVLLRICVYIYIYINIIIYIIVIISTSLSLIYVYIYIYIDRYRYIDTYLRLPGSHLDPRGREAAEAGRCSVRPFSYLGFRKFQFCERGVSHISA